MEENKKTTKKKFKRYLPIIIIILLLISCSAVAGLLAYQKANDKEVEKVEKEEEITINPNCMTEEEIEQLEDLVENLTEEEKATLKAEADSGVQDELTLRKLLLLEDEISIKVSKDIEIIATMPVKGKKTLTGEATIKLFVGAEVENNSILSVKQGAELAVEGLVLDASGVSSAVVVADGATFNFMSGEIQHGTAYGIHNKGTVNVSGGTISDSWGAAIGVESGAKTYISGGNLRNSVKNILWIAKGGSVEVTGGVLDSCYEYAVVNNGTFKMTGGTIKGANGGIKGYALWNNETAVIDGGSDYVEISDCAYGFYNSGMASTLTLNKVYWHDNTGYIGNVKAGTATITNCKFANTGTRGLIITNAVVEINNVEMTNIGETAFAVYKPSKVTAKNVTVNGVVNGNGYANYGADSVLKNITMNNVSSTAFYITSSTDTGTGEPGTITLKNCSASNSNSNVLLKHGSKVIADGCTFGETARTNVMLSKGTAQFTNAKLFGAIADDCSVLSIQKDASANLNNVEIAQGNRGIYLAGALTMKGGSIHDNEGIMQGCALSVAGTGTFTLDGVDIYNNKITNLFAGGGLYLNNDASGKVLNSTIKNNTIVGDGGAVYTGKATLEMQNCTIEGNTSSQGGAIYTKAGTVTLRGCTITNNASVGNTTKKWASKGGAIKTDKEANVTIDGCYFANNNASQAGAIFHGPGTLTISGGTVFENHTVTTNTGAVYSEGTLVDNGSIYRNNVVDGAGAGGAVRIEKGTATITGSKFYDSTTLGDGGAIYAKGALNLKGCEFDGSLSSQGAAIYLNNSGDEVSTISGCTFTNNKAVGYEPKSYDAKGGAICNNKGTLEISGGTIFKNNTSLKNSAAIFNKGTLVDSGSTYIENVVTGNGAGGAIRNEGGTATINGSTFVKNSTNEDGGAIYTNKPITVTNSTFTENTATRGGAIYCNVADASTISGCAFKGNTANGSSAHGGAIFIRNGEISDSTFTSNVAECGRDILVNSNATETVLSGTNTFDANGNNVYLLTSKNVQATVTLAGKATELNVIYTSDNIGIKLDDAFDQTSTVTMIPDGYQTEIQVVEAVQEASTSFADATQVLDVVLPDGDTSCVLTTNGYLGGVACAAIGNTTYTSLAAAVEAANDGDTIQILKDSTVASTIEITKSVKLTSESETTITGSTALSGNIFKVIDGATLEIVGSEGKEIIIDGNSESSATSSRAVEVASGATFKMTYGTIQNFNSSVNAVAVLNSGTTELTNVNVVNNTTNSSSSGDAMRNNGGATLTVTNSTFENNTGKSSGGVLYATGTSVTTFTGCTFKGNATTGSNGGAIHYNGSKTLTVTNCTFEENSAGQNGGAIYNNVNNNANIAEKVSISGCTFKNNTAVSKGGAISIQTEDKAITTKGAGAVISDSTFESNTAETGDNVYLSAAGFVTLSGELTGLTVYNTGANAGVRLAAEYNSENEVTLIPAVEGGYQIIANNGLEQADFERAIGNVTLVTDNLSGTWFINSEGCLVQDYCVQLQATGEKYYSLLDAVAAAKALEGDDVIVILRDFAVGSAITIDSNITITSDTGATITRGSGMTGNMFDVAAGATFTIQGSEGKEIVIDGNAGNSAVSARAVNVAAGGTFNMTYGKIENFYSSNYAGAAILNKGTVDIKNSEISNNKYEGNSVGGAIRTEGTPKLYITDTVFNNNSSTHSSCHGAAIRVNYVATTGDVKFTRCTFTNNTSAGEGGAIYYNDAKPIIIEDCTFTGNSAAKGGAISTRCAIINGAIFASNSANTTGNDVYLKNDSSFVTLSGKLTGLTVQYAANNVGVRIGGAIDAESDITIIPYEYADGVQVVAAADGVDVDTVFKPATKNMKLADESWGISTEGTMVQGYCVALNGVNYYSLTEAMENAKDGDTITVLKSFTINSPVTIDKSLTFTSNEAVTLTRGSSLTGNMFTVAAEKTFTIQGTQNAQFTIDGNAGSDTRAIYVSSSVDADAEAGTEAVDAAAFVMNYATIQNFNSAISGAGTAIYNMGTSTLTNAKIMNAKSSTANAGGAIRNQGGTLSMTDCLVSGGSNTGDGGALYTNNANVTLTRCEFNGNSSGSRGGAIYSNTNGISIVDCTFINNYTAKEGGAVWVKSASISGSTFTSNYTTANGSSSSNYIGGGAICVSGGQFICSDTTFNQNRTEGSQYSHGGAICIKTATLIQVEDCSFTGNFTRAKYGSSGSDSHGGAIYIYNYNTNNAGYIKNSSFVDNIAGCGAGDGTGDGAGAVGNNGSGGAIGIGFAKNFEINGCTFTRNLADNRGGAIYMNNASAVIYVRGCEFDGNASKCTSGDRGGAMQAHNGTIYYDSACTFGPNTDTINGSSASGTVTLLSDSEE